MTHWHLSESVANFDPQICLFVANYGDCIAIFRSFLVNSFVGTSKVESLIFRHFSSHWIHLIFFCRREVIVTTSVLTCEVAKVSTFFLSFFVYLHISHYIHYSFHLFQFTSREEWNSSVHFSGCLCRLFYGKRRYSEETLPAVDFGRFSDCIRTSCCYLRTAE